MILRESSQLYSMLCAGDNENGCSYPTVVKLTENIQCSDLECDIGTARVVQVSPEVFYEYVRMPCVHHAFFEDDMAKAVWAGGAGGASMCAHPSQPVATTTCCSSSSGGDTISCKYLGEYVTWATNKDRCGDSNVCDDKTSVSDASCKGQIRYSIRSPADNHFQWSDAPCNVKIKVRMDSMVALVHVSVKLEPFQSSTDCESNLYHLPFELGATLKPRGAIRRE